MYVETARCIIRNFRSDDAAEVYAVLSDKDVMRYIEPAFDMEKTIAFAEKYGMCESPLVYALEWRKTNVVIGHVIYHPYDENSYEIGWVLNKAYWGRGIADEVTKALIQYSKGITGSCVIECDERQQVSCHIALKNGFEFEGNSDGLNIYRLKLNK